MMTFLPWRYHWIKHHKYMLMIWLCFQINRFYILHQNQITMNKSQQEYVPHSLGIVESNSHNLRFYTVLKGQSERIQSIQDGIKQNLTSKLPFYLTKLCGLSTIQREYKVDRLLLTKRLYQISPLSICATIFFTPVNKMRIAHSTSVYQLPWKSN